MTIRSEEIRAMATLIVPKADPVAAPMGLDEHGEPYPVQATAVTMLPTLGASVCAFIEQHVLPGSQLGDELRAKVWRAFEYRPGDIAEGSPLLPGG
jgi:hypothetical protein